MERQRKHETFHITFIHNNFSNFIYLTKMALLIDKIISFAQFSKFLQMVIVNIFKETNFGIIINVFNVLIDKASIYQYILTT